MTPGNKAQSSDLKSKSLNKRYYALAVVAAVMTGSLSNSRSEEIKPTDSAIIENTGSTNSRGYREVIEASGRVSFASGKSFNASPDIAMHFLKMLDSLMPLSKISAFSCMKSVSFGSATYITFRGEKSPDIECTQYGATLFGEINKINHSRWAGPLTEKQFEQYEKADKGAYRNQNPDFSRQGALYQKLESELNADASDSELEETMNSLFGVERNWSFRNNDVDSEIISHSTPQTVRIRLISRLKRNYPMMDPNSSSNDYYDDLKGALELRDEQIAKLKNSDKANSIRAQEQISREKKILQELEDQIRNNASDAQVHATIDQYWDAFNGRFGVLEKHRSEKASFLTPTQRGWMLLGYKRKKPSKLYSRDPRT